MNLQILGLQWGTQQRQQPFTEQVTMENPEVSVGIDLGTTFSAVAHVDSEGRPLTIINSEGELTTPSAVFFDHDAVIVGTEATIAGESDTDRLARNAKRDMGDARYRKKNPRLFSSARSDPITHIKSPEK